jgi:hypothetical protein
VVWRSLLNPYKIFQKKYFNEVVVIMTQLIYSLFGKGCMCLYIYAGSCVSVLRTEFRKFTISSRDISLKGLSLLLLLCLENLHNNIIRSLLYWSEGLTAVFMTSTYFTTVAALSFSNRK